MRAQSDNQFVTLGPSQSTSQVYSLLNDICQLIFRLVDSKPLLSFLQDKHPPTQDSIPNNNSNYNPDPLTLPSCLIIKGI